MNASMRVSLTPLGLVTSITRGVLVPSGFSLEEIFRSDVLAFGAGVNMVAHEPSPWVVLPLGPVISDRKLDFHKTNFRIESSGDSVIGTGVPWPPLPYGTFESAL